MSKGMLKKVLGLIALIGVVVLGFLLIQDEEVVDETEVVGVPPGIVIDTGYNATLSGTPFYTVLQADEDMLENNLATCTDLGGESDRQAGWYSLVALEDGKTAKEVVFEQAQLEEGDNLLAVYYNPLDKTFEAMPNRIIKASDRSDLPMLDWDRELKKGEVIVVNSNRSVDFCKNYKASAGHEEVTVGSWNLVSKPNFENLGYRSIWGVDFSGKNLSQFYKEPDTGFDTDTLSEDDLYWIYGGTKTDETENDSDDNSQDDTEVLTTFNVEKLLGSRFENGEVAETILFGEVTQVDLEVGNEVVLACDDVAVTGTVTRILSGDATQNSNLSDTQSASIGDKVTVFVSGVTPDQIDCQIPGQVAGSDSGGTDSENGGGNIRDRFDDFVINNPDLDIYDPGRFDGFDFGDFTTGIPVMEVEEAITISGRGTVFTGKVISGTVETEKQVTIQCDSFSGTYVVSGVETSDGSDTASEGDTAGVLLRGVNKDDIECFRSDDTATANNEPLKMMVQLQGMDRVQDLTFEFEKVYANGIGTGFYGVDENGLIFENFSQEDNVFRALSNMTYIGRACAVPAEGSRTTPCKPDYARDANDVFVTAASVGGQDYSLISWIGRDDKFYRFKQEKTGLSSGTFEIYPGISNIKDAEMTKGEEEKELFITFDCNTGSLAEEAGGLGIFGRDTPYRASKCSLISFNAANNFDASGEIYWDKPFNVLEYKGNRLFVGKNRNQVWMTDSIDGTSYKFKNIRTSGQIQEEYTVNRSSGNLSRGLSSIFYGNDYMFGIGRNNRLYGFDIIDGEWDLVTAGSDQYAMRDITNIGSGIILADGGVRIEGESKLAYSVGCFSAGDICKRSDESPRGQYLFAKNVVSPVSIDNVVYYSNDNAKSFVSKYKAIEDDIDQVESLNDTFSSAEAIQYLKSGSEIYLYLQDGSEYYLYMIQD